MWNETEIEKLFVEKIKQESELTHSSNTYITHYNTLKDYLCTHLYADISRVEPDLTDHGAEHIKNVLQNAYSLIKDDDLNGIELYVLCMAILIHDIGNLDGREGHEKKLRLYFNKNKFNTIDNDHIKIISLIASKHGGKDCDAIGGGNLPIKGTLDRILLRSQKVAAIVRFADELAEGKQRSSTILLENQQLASGSEIYHDYAQILKPPHILKDTIALEFVIDLDQIKTPLDKLLPEIFNRIEKLNNEKTYCSHFCKSIQNINKVTVSLKFYQDDNFDEIQFSDNNLVNFEFSGKNIHCKENENREEHIQKILAYLNEKNNIKSSQKSFFQRIISFKRNTNARK